jgi:dTDP-4-amino-4,6-dideoxygalactose transaminase
MSDAKVPFFNLVTVHKEIEEELVGVLRTALATAGFIGGPMVDGFEHDFAKFCEAQFCVGVGSGTDALRFALIAAGINPGDIVVTVPNTFIATTEAISQAGARPDFVDVDEQTYNMDTRKLRRYLENDCSWNSSAKQAFHKRTGSPVTAVIPVHLYGQMADMDSILELACEYNLIVVEDACQAHGAEYFSKKENRWHKAGSMGQVAAFSFYPGKNLGACGEAGAITTNNEDIARRCRVLRDHGQSKKYYHDIEGYNGRLDAIQAGMLLVKLRKLSEWNEQRRKCADTYDQLLASVRDRIVLPTQPTWVKSVHHLYVIRAPRRDELRAYLESEGIGTGIHYPIPLHLQTAYRKMEFQKGDFPVSEKAATEILSLPMFPHLQIDQQRQVVDKVQRFLLTLNKFCAA